MTQCVHEAYLLQARSDFAVFELLVRQGRADVPECYALHYLQMATEKLAKAAFLALRVPGLRRFDHVAFSLVPLHLRRRDVARGLGWSDFRVYQTFVTRTRPVFRETDELAPAVGPRLDGGGPAEGPNVEYPWPVARNEETCWVVPAEHGFGLLDRLRRSGDAAQVLGFIRRLMERFEGIFR